MFPENISLRIVIIVLMVSVMFGIFTLIIWRGGVVLGVEGNIKKTMLIAGGLLLILVASMAINFLPLPGNITEMIGAVPLWIIYSMRVLVPILLVADIVGIRYRIPAPRFLCACVVYLGRGIYNGTHTKITEVTIANNRLTQDHKIVFISDLHVEAIHNRAFIQSIVDRIQTLKPDFVLIGGDLMNTAKLSYVDAFLPFKQLTIPVYAIVGNHDRMGDQTAVAKIFSTTNIIPLRDQSIQQDSLQIVGIDDRSYRSGKTLSGILDQAQIANNGEFTILVAHQPENLKKLAGYPIDLELAGHTHNGQFFPLQFLIRAINDYAYGRYTLGDKTAFVSQGIGSRGAPIRIGTQSEMVLISLKKK